MRTRDLKRATRKLPPERLKEFGEWVNEFIRAAATPPTADVNPGRKEAGGRRKAATITYRLEGVRCGKEGCKCASGELHGPYWYAYWSEGGRSRSQYIGKRLPKGVKPQRNAKSRGVR